MRACCVYAKEAQALKSDEKVSMLTDVSETLPLTPTTPPATESVLALTLTLAVLVADAVDVGSATQVLVLVQVTHPGV